MTLIVDPRFLRYSDFQRLRNCPETIVCILEEDVYYENVGEKHRFWCEANVQTYPVPPQDSHIKVSREGDHWLCHSPSPLTLPLHLLEKPTEYRKASIDLEWEHYLQFDALTEGTPYFLRFEDVWRKSEGWDFFVRANIVWFTDVMMGHHSVSIFLHGKHLWSPDFEVMEKTPDVMEQHEVDDEAGLVFIQTNYDEYAWNSFEQQRSRCQSLLRWFPFAIAVIIMDYLWISKIQDLPICNEARQCFLPKKTKCFPFSSREGRPMGLFMDPSTHQIFPLLHVSDNVSLQVSEEPLSDNYFQVALQWQDGQKKRKRDRKGEYKLGKPLAKR